MVAGFVLPGLDQATNASHKPASTRRRLDARLVESFPLTLNKSISFRLSSSRAQMYFGSIGSTMPSHLASEFRWIGSSRSADST